MKKIIKTQQQGFSLLETLVAVTILSLSVASVSALNSQVLKSTTQTNDRSFASQKATQMFEELRSFVQANREEPLKSLQDYFSNGTSEYVPTLTTEKRPDTADPNNRRSDLYVNPSDALSNNTKMGNHWKYVRNIQVAPVPSDPDARHVTVKVWYSNAEGEPDNRERPLAVITGILKTNIPKRPPTQVYDLYAVGLENTIGWWVALASLHPTFDRTLDDLMARNPGLEIRKHYITRLTYGRDPFYTPYMNSTDDLRDGNTPFAYLYPGNINESSSRSDTVKEMYLDSLMQGRRRNDTENLNIFRSTDTTYPNSDYDESQPSKKWRPYAMGDQFNNSLRAPEEKAMYTRLKTWYKQDTSKTLEPSLRLLLDGMNDEPDVFRNTMMINMHGELLPIPPVRNYSDPAKIPCDETYNNGSNHCMSPSTSLSSDSAMNELRYQNMRVVTHPEKIKYDNSDNIRLRVYGFQTRPLNSNSLPSLPANLYTANNTELQDFDRSHIEKTSLFVPTNGQGVDPRDTSLTGFLNNPTANFSTNIAGVLGSLNIYRLVGHQSKPYHWQSKATALTNRPFTQLTDRDVLIDADGDSRVQPIALNNTSLYDPTSVIGDNLTGLGRIFAYDVNGNIPRIALKAQTGTSALSSDQISALKDLKDRLIVVNALVGGDENNQIQSPVFVRVKNVLPNQVLGDADIANAVNGFVTLELYPNQTLPIEQSTETNPANPKTITKQFDSSPSVSAQYTTYYNAQMAARTAWQSAHDSAYNTAYANNYDSGISESGYPSVQGFNDYIDNLTPSGNCTAYKLTPNYNENTGACSNSTRKALWRSNAKADSNHKDNQSTDDMRPNQGGVQKFSPNKETDFKTQFDSQFEAYYIAKFGGQPPLPDSVEKYKRLHLGVDLQYDENLAPVVTRHKDFDIDVTNPSPYGISTAGFFINLYDTPTRQPMCSDATNCSSNRYSGLNDTRRLYGQEYIPAPFGSNITNTNSPSNGTPFGRDLTDTTGSDNTTNTVFKNTARWIVELQKSGGSGAFSSLNNSVIAVETRLARANTYSIRLKNEELLEQGLSQDGMEYQPNQGNNEYKKSLRPNLYNVSRSYVWTGTQQVPTSEQYQYLGDPRFMPYADVQANQGQNVNFLKDINNNGFGTGGSGFSNISVFSRAQSAPSSSGQVNMDFARAGKWYADGVMKSNSIYNSISGWSSYYIGLGGDFGADSNNVMYRVNNQAFTESNDTADVDVTCGLGTGCPGPADVGNAGSVKLVFSNAGDSSRWASLTWQGELFPDEEYTFWKFNGNLPTSGFTSQASTYNDCPSSGGACTTRSSAPSYWRSQISTDPINLKDSSRARNITGGSGAELLMNGNTTGSGSDNRFSHFGNGSTGTLTTGAGARLNKAFNLALEANPNTARPFGLNTDETAPTIYTDDIMKNQRNLLQLLNSETGDFESSANQENVYYTSDTGGGTISSGLVVASRNSIGPGFFLINGLSQVGSNSSITLARFSAAGVLQAYLSGGTPKVTPATSNARTRMIPRVEILEPTASDIQEDHNISVQFKAQWLRWDLEKYSPPYESNWQDQNKAEFILKYSANGGQSWKYLDGSPAKDLGQYDPDAVYNNASFTIPGGATGLEQTFTWNAPASMENGTYLLRIECYRFEPLASAPIANGYSYHESYFTLRSED